MSDDSDLSTNTDGMIAAVTLPLFGICLIAGLVYRFVFNGTSPKVLSMFILTAVSIVLYWVIYGFILTTGNSHDNYRLTMSVSGWIILLFIVFLFGPTENNLSFPSFSSSIATTILSQTPLEANPPSEDQRPSDQNNSTASLSSSISSKSSWLSPGTPTSLSRRNSNISTTTDVSSHGSNKGIFPNRLTEPWRVSG